MTSQSAVPNQASIPAWAWPVMAFTLFGLYLLSMDNGFALQGMAEKAHEFFHDGRHFLGVPCH